MKAFSMCEGAAAPLLRDNVDTDVIVRIERVAQAKRGETGQWAFEILRYRPDGREDPDFILNQGAFRHAQILLTGRNFGCGSSREMAVWALDDFGIRCIIAESYGDIFYSNCLQVGVLPVTLERSRIEQIAEIASTGTPVKVDLRTRVISATGLQPVSFHFSEAQRHVFLSGMDEVDHTLSMAAEIERFQWQDRRFRPWIYGVDQRG